MKPPPPLPQPTGVLDVPGFTLGHGSDTSGMTGLTVILCPEGVVGAAEVRGTATSTRQFDSLVTPHSLGGKVNAVVLAGGSAFGLSSADVVVAELAAGGYGFQTGLRPVPLVPTAILFDLAFGDAAAVPGDDLARQAFDNAAAGPVTCGSVGAGTGATVGKSAGFARAMKGGFGFAGLKVAGGPRVAAAVAVNAFGDIRDPETGRPVAGCRAAPDSSVLVGADRLVAHQAPDHPHPWEGNTTLAVVMTDAKLDKRAALKVCEMAFGGFYRAITPALSLYDGDLIVTLSSGRVAAHLHQVGVLAEWAVAQAILEAVRRADGFGILPAVRDLEPAR